MRRMSLLASCLSIAALTAICPITPSFAEIIKNIDEDFQIAQNSQPKSLLLDVTGNLELGDEQLDDGSFVDIYTFQGQTGQPVTILLESIAFDAYLWLIDPQGNLLTTNNDIGSGNHNAALMVTLPTDGTYQVLANNRVPTEQGAYSLKIAQTELLQANPFLSLQETQQLAAEQVFQQGSQHYARSEFREAIIALESALASYQQLGDRARESLTNSSLGLVYESLYEYDQALSYYQQALEITQELGNPAQEGVANGNLGLVYDSLGQYDQALKYHQHALEIFQKLGDRAREGTATSNLGVVYYNLGQYSQALRYDQQALEIAQEIGDRAGEGRINGNLGLVFFSQGQYDQALRYHQQALKIAQEIGHRAEEGKANGNLGIVYDIQGQYEQALKHHQQDLAIAQEIGDWGREGLANGNLGILYANLGQYDQALRYHQRALTIAQEINNRAEEGRANGNLGIVYENLGQYDQALRYFQQSLTIAQELKDRAGEGGSYTNLGVVHANLGQYNQALRDHQRALEISQEIGDRAGEGNVYTNLGNVYIRLGQYDQALRYSQQALEISQEIGHRAGEGTANSNLGLIYHSQSQYDQALRYHQQALEIAQEIGDQAGEGRANTNLGIVYGSQSQYDQALRYFQQDLKITQKIGDRAGEERANNNLGIVYGRLGEHNQAQRYFQRALEIAQEIGDRAGAGHINGMLGVAYHKLEQYQAAIQTLQKAVHMYESLRSVDLEDVNQLSLLDSQQDTYGYLQYVLTDRGQPKAALEFSDRSRAQALKLQLLQTLPEEQAAPWTKHLSIQEMQQIIAQQSATLVSYTVLWNGEVLIWVIQPDGRIYQTSSDLAALPDSVDKVLTPFATSNAARGAQRPDTPLQNLIRGTQSEITVAPISEGDLGLDRLYQVLIKPIAHLLPEDETDRVIFIPHRELFQVPFAALQNPETGDYLIENHTISIAPSILSLALTQERQAQLNGSSSGALIVGNPNMSRELAEAHDLEPLGGAEAEATVIQSLLKASDDDVLTGNLATEQAVADRIHSARYLHFATHGLLLDKPLYSTIAGLLALAPSPEDELGEFTVQDILNLTQDNPLNAELAVLSACRTGDGGITSDGAFGLARAFLVGGVPSLVVSLRDVPDDATKELMTAFYTEMLKTSDKAQALRHAMLTTMDEYPDPRAWGAFVLIGQPD